ncbi:MAG: ATP-binding protein [Propionibacteriaceae bacterium]|nr:ATP-binding protein [Propionibacteriaceae bacterium]
MDRQLRAAGAVWIRGPKGCGKTATGRQHAQSEILVQRTGQAAQLFETDPALIFEGATPRLIDEWQEQPALWDLARVAVDQRGAKGQFILTGSSTPRDSQTAHSGVGRFGVIDMRTMSWSEMGWSTGAVKLSQLMNGETVKPDAATTAVTTIAEHLAIGGWPQNIGLDEADARLNNANYLSLLVESDLSKLTGERRDPQRVLRTIQSLSRNSSSEASISSIAADAGGSDGSLADETVSEYLRVFHRLMIEEDLPAWSTHVASRARLRQAPKRQLADTSLACAALGLSSEKLVADLAYMGQLFESAAVHDLRVYAQALGANVYHYRDSNGLEVDVVVELLDGRWAAFEAKLGQGAADKAADTLLRFADQIDQSKVGPPAALCVLSGTGFTRTRPDGVSVVPLAALGP